MAFAGPFASLDEAGQFHQCLFQFLVAFIPFFFWRRADVCTPAIGQPFGRVVKTGVFPSGRQVMRHSRFHEIARVVTFMVRFVGPAPVALDRIEGLQVAIGLLRSQNLGDPIVQSFPKTRLGFGNLLVLLCIDHQRHAH